MFICIRPVRLSEVTMIDVDPRHCLLLPGLKSHLMIGVPASEKGSLPYQPPHPGAAMDCCGDAKRKDGH